MKLKGIRQSHHNRVNMHAGQVEMYNPIMPDANVVIFFNHTAGNLGFSPYSDADRNPMMVTPQGGTVAWAVPTGVSSMYLSTAADGLVDVLEYVADEVTLDVQVNTSVGGVNVNNFPGTQAVSPAPGAVFKVDINGATIQAGNIYTELTAVPADGSNPDSVILAGTTDGLAPAAGGANAGWLRVLGGAALVEISNWVADQLMHGHVDVDSLPAVQLAGWTPKLVTAPDVDHLVQEVKAGAGQVARILPLAGVAVTLQDGAAPAWAEVTAEVDFSAAPIGTAGNINLAFGAPGSAWILYR